MTYMGNNPNNPYYKLCLCGNRIWIQRKKQLEEHSYSDLCLRCKKAFLMSISGVWYNMHNTRVKIIQ